MQQDHLLMYLIHWSKYQTPNADPWYQIGINIASYVGQQIYVGFTYARDTTGVLLIKVI